MTIPYFDLLDTVSGSFGLPINLLAAQMMAESSGDPWAFRFEPAYYARYIRGNTAAKGAKYGPLAACSYGLMQIMFETALEVGFTGQPHDLFDPLTGLTWGATMMHRLWSAAGGRTSDYDTALAAYNGGPSLLHQSVNNWPAGVHTYVARVHSINKSGAAINNGGEQA